jgi:2-isopropylmalate synthase
MAGFENKQPLGAAEREIGRVAIADTTIRDEHLLRANPRLLADRNLADVWRSCTLALEDRVAIARQLADLGVDVVEAGFIETPEGAAAVAVVAAELSQGGPIVSSLVSAFSGSGALQAAIEAVSTARRPRVHVHVDALDLVDADGNFRRHPTLLLDQALGAIEAVGEAIPDIEFSPPRTSLEAVETAAEWAKAAAEGGAKTINLRYSAEGPEPDDFLALIAEFRRFAALPSEVVLSADVFVQSLRGAEAYVAATGCSEAALDAGCRQVKCAFHGITATPGHASLEMLAFQIWLRNYLGESHLRSNVDTKRLLEAGERIAEAKGFDLPPSQPLLGEDVTAPSPASFSEDPSERILTATATRIVLRGLGVPIPAWLDEYTDPPPDEKGIIE